MCLGEIAEVTGVQLPGSAEVSGDGRTRTVSLLTLDEPVVVGDWLLIHSGFALSRLTPEAAHTALTLRNTPSL